MKSIKNRNSIFIKNNTSHKNKFFKKLLNNFNSPQKLNNFTNINKTLKKSFSPRINKYLVSFTKKKPSKFLLCNNNLLKINISKSKKSQCLDYNNEKVKKFLLNNLKTSKNINCGDIIPPKQVLSNCWFNTFFVTFFISDKGRKFFKYFRQLMIEGKLINGVKLSTNLARAFFMLNIAIEASSNNLLNNIAYKFNTNLLIQKIYTSINNKNYFNNNIRKKGDAGNPLDYYMTIFNYLNAGEIFSVPITLFNSASNTDIEDNLVSLNIQIKPDIIILEIYDKGRDGAGPSGKINNKKNVLNIFNTKYSLDSAIVRDTGGQHFCSLLTCNNKEYCFDGASFNRLSPMNWKQLINSSKIWQFQGHNLKWNFKNSYQLLFYYRIN